MNGPTPEQIAAEAPFPADLERLAFLARLTSNGYVIIHPDDIAEQAAPDGLFGSTYNEAFRFGWQACMERIIATAEQETR